MMDKDPAIQGLNRLSRRIGKRRSFVFSTFWGYPSKGDFSLFNPRLGQPSFCPQNFPSRECFPHLACARRGFRIRQMPLVLERRAGSADSRE
jgi:hypothetical protein